MLCTGLTMDASSYVKKWRATLAKLTRPLVNGENRRSLFPAVKLLPLFLVPRQRTEQVREKQRCVSPVQTDQFTLIDPRSVATVDTGLFVTAPNARGHVENFLLAGEISPPWLQLWIICKRQQLPFIICGFSNHNCPSLRDFKSFLLNSAYKSPKPSFRCWFCDSVHLHGRVYEKSQWQLCQWPRKTAGCRGGDSAARNSQDINMDFEYDQYSAVFLRALERKQKSSLTNWSPAQNCTSFNKGWKINRGSFWLEKKIAKKTKKNVFNYYLQRVVETRAF